MPGDDPSDSHGPASFGSDDPHDLGRFLEAQDRDYERALAELASGRKRTHWMWYVFPQLSGLGSSPTAQRFAIRGLDEARAYLDHPILGARLLECVDALLRIEDRTANGIFGSPDDMKLRSCATLFAGASPPGSAFERLLAKYFWGEADPKTMELLRNPGR